MAKGNFRLKFGRSLQLIGYFPGKRHYELMRDRLPEQYVWIDITVPLEEVFEKYAAYCEVVVFASGDPLFFGFANTVKSRLPEAEIQVFPWFNSLQMLAHRLVIPYQDMEVVSLTGRPWHEFDRALIAGKEKIGGVDRPSAYSGSDCRAYVGIRVCRLPDAYR